MKVIKNNIISLVVIFFAAALAALFFTYFEKESYQRYKGFSGEARTNQLLALQHLLKEFSYPVTKLDAFTLETSLPGNDSLFIINDKNIYKNSALISRLMKWAHGGGTLIMNGYSNITDPDAPKELIAELGISMRKTEAEIKHEAEPKITFNNSDYRLNLHHFSIIDENKKMAWKISDEHGIHIAGFNYGSGHLIIINDLYFVTNYSIKDDDHAQFIVDLIRSYPVKLVTMTSKAFDQSLLVFLMGYPYPFSLFILLCFFFTWYYLNRFGPIYIESSYFNQTNISFLRAIGSYFWKTGHIEELFNQHITDLKRTLDSYYPEHSSLQGAEYFQILEQDKKIPLKLLKNAFNNEKPVTPGQLISALRSADKIRKHIDGK